MADDDARSQAGGSVVASRRSSAATLPAEQVTFTLELVAQPTPEAAAQWRAGEGRVPFFRCVFPPTGEHVGTPRMNEGGWTQESADGDGEAPEGEDEGEAEDDGVPPLYKFKKEWKGVKMTAAKAEQLAENPILTLFMGDHALTDGAGDDASDAGGDDGEEAARGGPAARRTRYYGTGFRTFADCSAFLDNDLEVLVTHGSTALFEDTMANDGRSAARRLARAPEGLDRLDVRITVDKPALSEALRVHLNPLAFTLRSLLDLPGVVMAEGDPSLARFVTPSKFTLMERFCRPVYVTYTFFDGDAWPRVVRSPGYHHRDSMVLDHKSVFLTGLMTSEEVVEHIVEAPVRVEIHDRDPAKTPSVMGREFDRLEGYIDGTWVEPTEDAESEGDDDGSAAAGKSDAESGEDAADDDDSAADGAQSAAGGAKGKPVGKHAVHEVDKMAVQAIDEELRTAGDHFAHGVAEMRLDKLLDRSAERLEAIKAREAARQERIAAEEAKLEAAKRAKARRKEIARRRAAGEDVKDDDSGDADGAGDAPAGSVAGDAPAASVAGSVRSGRGGSVAGSVAASVAGTPATEPMKSMLTVDVMPAKRRVVPKGGEVLYDISEEQRVTRQPGAYTLADTRIKVTMTMARPLQTQPAELPPPALAFERAVICMRYEEDELLKKVLAVLKRVNTRAIKNILSIRSHQLTDEEFAAAEDGTLDVLTGFQVVDDHWRILVVEGLSSGAMARLHREVPRQEQNNVGVKYLSNPTVRFKKRLYAAFNVAPKDIRLREPLGRIIKQPDIYNRSKVSAMTFDCLHRLYEMRNALRLVELKSNQLFPTAEMLQDLENKYGDTVTVTDMEGSRDSPRTVAVSVPGSPGAKSPGASTVGRAQEGFGGSASTGHGGGRHRETLQTSNPAFEASRKQRRKVNFLAANKTALAGSGTGRQQTVAVDTEGKEPPGRQVFPYSGQKLNYTEWQKEAMRKRLSKDKKSTYTYSSDYQSLTVCLVNEAELAQVEEAEKRKKWTTPNGFVYPAPKDPAEFRRHPKAPDATRAEDLATPWVENAVLEATKARPDHLHDSGKPEFDVVPVRSVPFGYVDAKGEKNPDFFKSVHLTGDGLAKEAEENKKRAEEEWRAKVVVDSDRFLPHYTAKHESQLAKLEGLLKGPVKRKALRIVHSAKLPSGRPTAAPTAAPASMLSGEPYEDPKDFTTTLKPNDPTTYMRDATGRQTDFAKYVRNDMGRPKAQNLLWKRPIPELSEAEKVGPRWHAVPVGGGIDTGSQSSAAGGAGGRTDA